MLLNMLIKCDIFVLHLIIDQDKLANMNRTTTCLIFLFIVFLFGSCSGIKYLTVETHEPAQVILPPNVLKITVVNNVVQQPDDIGHNLKKIGSKEIDREKASSDSISIFYTEALTQFLNEEDYFQWVTLYNNPLRNDKDFFQEQGLDPQIMNRIREETGADAIISLDKLLIETRKREHFKQQGYIYGDLTGNINSIVRVYLPTLEGKIPVVQYLDSLKWEGFDIQDGNAYAEVMLPSREEAMKILAVRAAEKMSYVFAPHWERQDRWFYTLPNSKMREGEVSAEKAEWLQAIEKWETFYNSQSKKINKAKAANNIALAYEMLDDMETSFKWAEEANNLFNESTSPNSLERRRSLIYKNEIKRRLDTSNKINMQNE